MHTTGTIAHNVVLMFRLMPRLICDFFICLLGFGAWLLDRSNCDRTSGLPNIRRCCALKLEGKSQVGIIPVCASSEGRMMPC